MWVCIFNVSEPLATTELTIPAAVAIVEMIDQDNQCVPVPSIELTQNWDDEDVQCVPCFTAVEPCGNDDQVVMSFLSLSGILIWSSK